MPMYDRYLTSLLASYNGRLLLIDCGEGTQVSMKLLGWGFKYIDIICLTHYHADHIVGLPGLLLTIANSGRMEELTIIGPQGLRSVIDGLRVLFPVLPYSLKLVEISADKIESYSMGDFTINTLPVDHGVSCAAYGLEVKRNRKFDRNKAEAENIPMKYWNRIQKGEEIIYNDRILTPDMVLGDERRGLKVCYCTDTRPVPQIVNFIDKADLFICEGMYAEEESLPKAIANRHMLFSEAAELALKGRVKELWLTHFSPALHNPENYLENASRIFKNTIIGTDRLKKEIFFTE